MNLPYEEYKEKLDVLTAQKRTLELQCNILDGAQFAQDWKELAEKFGAIDARANYFACMRRYEEYAGLIKEPQPQSSAVAMLESVFSGEEFEPVGEIQEPEFDSHFDWQERADIGD